MIDGDDKIEITESTNLAIDDKWYKNLDVSSPSVALIAKSDQVGVLE